MRASSRERGKYQDQRPVPLLLSIARAYRQGDARDGAQLAVVIFEEDHPQPRGLPVVQPPRFGVDGASLDGTTQEARVLEAHRHVGFGE